MVTQQTSLENQEAIRNAVRQGYSQVAQGNSCCGPTASCCGASTQGSADELAARLGYDEAELATLPEGANMGLSCGNPTAIASLLPGEVVLDLGSGGGFDAFIAGQKVGVSGKVIGVDMTPDMLTKARKNAVVYAKRTGLDNVEFRLGEIEHLPVADNSVDVVISNCVINLSPDKPQVWQEIFRVLKPGGRVAVSDLALKQPLPDAIRAMVEALVGCVAGAALITENETMAHDAGLIEIELEEKPVYIESMVDSDDPLYRQILDHLPAGASTADYITSLYIKGKKPSC